MAKSIFVIASFLLLSPHILKWRREDEMSSSSSAATAILFLLLLLLPQ
jgi:hypothetical protein